MKGEVSFAVDELEEIPRVGLRGIASANNLRNADEEFAVVFFISRDCDDEHAATAVPAGQCLWILLSQCLKTVAGKTNDRMPTDHTGDK